jgi:hypothetical protein
METETPTPDTPAVPAVTLQHHEHVRIPGSNRLVPGYTIKRPGRPVVVLTAGELGELVQQAYDQGISGVPF